MFTIIYCLTFKQVKNHKLIVISFWLMTEDLQIERVWIQDPVIQIT